VGKNRMDGYSRTDGNRGTLARPSVWGVRRFHDPDCQGNGAGVRKESDSGITRYHSFTIERERTAGETGSRAGNRHTSVRTAGTVAHRSAARSRPGCPPAVSEPADWNRQGETDCG